MGNISPNLTFVIMLVGDVCLDVTLCNVLKRNKLKNAWRVSTKLQKGYEVITIGGLYGTVDEVDTENKTIVLDVDGVYLTFELGAIKSVLPLKEAVTSEGTVVDGESAIEE